MQYAITGLTTHFMRGLMFNLVICKFRKSMVTYDTESFSCDQVPLDNTNQTLYHYHHHLFLFEISVV